MQIFYASITTYCDLPDLTIFMMSLAEREAVNAAERAERKQQLRDKVSSLWIFSEQIYLFETNFSYFSHVPVNLHWNFI